jgi:pimeloyl-ACP methyl ester carboxylesterase
MTGSPPQRGLLFWLTRTALTVAGLVVLLLGAAAAYQFAADKIEQNTLKQPGRFVQAGSRTLYVHCLGDASRPAIVFENGLGVVAEEWTWVQAALADRYHVCAYDRAGTGRSPAVDGPIDAVTSSADLAALIDALRIEGPIVLVGHSYGALIARVFTARYPDHVRGLVLVDSSHEDMAERFPPQAQEGFKELLAGMGQLRLMNVFGFARLGGAADQMSKGLAGEAHARARHLYASVHHFAGAAVEAEGWERSAAAAREVKDFGALPLTVFAVDGWPAFMLPSWLEMQNDLAAKSSAGKFVLVEGADHFSVIHDKSHAENVAGEIDLVAQAGR